MSKVDDLRALREARYAVMTAGKGQGKSQGKGMKGQRVDKVVVDEVQQLEALCGHQAIGGKRCIRPKDHAEKNHRYAKAAK